MDSGNSGSMQSSSGGEEEYDSRAESARAFLNPPSHYSSSMSNPRPSFFHQHHNHQANSFDLSSNYLHALSQPQANSNPHSMLHPDAVQSSGLGSEADCTDLGNLPGSSSSGQSFLAARGLNQGSSLSATQMQPGQENGARAAVQPNVVRSSKKRTRATRRAPTTVLTTDTSNFRAMVQEFTGIPAPPFSGSSYSRRLDLFGTSSALRSGHLEPVGTLYPLRPSAQKVQPSPFLSSSSSSSSLLNSTMVDATNVASTANSHFSSTLNNFHQLPSNLGLPRQPLNILNMQNPILTFQSPPQPNVHSSLNVSGFGAPSPGSLALPSLEELGMSHGHADLNLSGLPNHGAGSNDGSQEHLRPLEGHYGNSPRVGGCKMNYSASSSSDFNHEKALETVSTRGEGTVDSWLCHSG